MVDRRLVVSLLLGSALGARGATQPGSVIPGTAAASEAAVEVAGPLPLGEAPESGSEALFDLAMRRPEELESRIREAFARLLGDPEHLELEIDAGRLSERLGGRFSRIRARFRGGRFDRLRVAEARLEAFDVHYDLAALLSGRTFVPRSVGETRLALRIDESAINDTVGSVRGKLRVDEPRFDLTPERIAFRGRIKFLFMRQDARIEGALSVRNGSQLHFRPDQVSVGSIPLPGFLVRALERRFNPVVRLERAPFWKHFRATLGRVEIGDGWIAVESATVPEAPRGAPGQSEPTGTVAPEEPVVAVDEQDPGTEEDGASEIGEVPEGVLHSGADPEAF